MFSERCCGSTRGLDVGTDFQILPRAGPLGTHGESPNYFFQVALPEAPFDGGAMSWSTTAEDFPVDMASAGASRQGTAPGRYGHENRLGLLKAERGRPLGAHGVAIACRRTLEPALGTASRNWPAVGSWWKNNFAALHAAMDHVFPMEKVAAP